MKKSHLTLDQRYTIQHQKEAGETQAAIGIQIGKHRSVVCRELKRNENSMGRYKAEQATQICEIRKERLKRPRKLSAGMEKEIRKSLMKSNGHRSKLRGTTKRTAVKW